LFFSTVLLLEVFKGRVSHWCDILVSFLVVGMVN
jgi:hypothetical protein